MWNVDIWMQKPRACSFPFLKCPAWAFKPRLPRRKTLYQSCLSSWNDSESWYALSWFEMLTGVCFSHDHFLCQLRTYMFWSQTCNDKADGLEIRQGMSCSGCLGPLCEEMNYLSVANRIASHIWWSAAYYIYIHDYTCAFLCPPHRCAEHIAVRRGDSWSC